jgi:hypothetical protein
MRKPQKRAHAPLSGWFEGGDRNLCRKVAAISTSQLEAPNNTTKILQHQQQALGDFFLLGFQEAKSNKFLKWNGWGNQISLVEV